MTQHIDNQEPLLTDVLTDEAMQEFGRASLAKALVVLERRRRNRKLARVCLVALLLVAPVSLLVKRTKLASPISQHGPGQSMAHSTTRSSLPDGVEEISDRELLALFPNQTVALIGGPGQQRLLVLDKYRSEHSELQ